MARSDAIGTGAVVLTADADGLVTGFARAKKMFMDFGKGIGSSSKSLFGGLGPGITGAIGSALSSRSLLTGGVVGASATAAGAFIGHKVVDSITDVAKQGDIASALGLSSEQFTGMAGLAKSVGEDTKEFVESIVTMGKLGRDAAAGVGEVAGPAFAAMGLDAKQFIGLRADQQFFALFEALGKVQDKSKQVGLLMNAFGEDGGKLLLPLLSKTPAKLREMARGFTVTTEEMERATKAQAAFLSLETSWDKAWRSLSINLADPFASMAKDLEKMVPLAKQFMTAIAPAAADRAVRFTRGVAESGVALSKMEGSKAGGLGAPKAEEIPHIVTGTILGAVDLWTRLDDLHSQFLNLGEFKGPNSGSYSTLKSRNEKLLADQYAEALNPPVVPYEVDWNAKFSGWLSGAERFGEKLGRTISAALADATEARAKEFFPGLNAVAGFGNQVAGDLLKAQYRSALGPGSAFYSALGAALPLDAVGGALASGGAMWRDMAHNNPFRAGKAGAGGEPQFAAAIQAGSAEAYSLELKNRFRTDADGSGNKVVDAVKEATREIRRMSGDMSEVRRLLGRWPDEVETV